MQFWNFKKETALKITLLIKVHDMYYYSCICHIFKAKDNKKQFKWTIAKNTGWTVNDSDVDGIIR